MPEPTNEPLALEATALRYAARTLSSAEAAAFEARLGCDQAARDALSEAVRLSAAALKQDAPSPGRNFRSTLRRRLARSGHPLVWLGLGSGVVAAAAVFAVQVADRSAPAGTVQVVPQPLVAAPTPRVAAPVVEKHDEPTEPVSAENSDDMRKAAEIWAELSTPDHVEKTHDDEARLQQRFKSLRPASGFDSHQP